VESLAAEFHRLNCNSIVITRAVQDRPLVARRRGVTVYSVPVFGPKPLRSAAFRIASSMLIILFRKRYDVIHAHSLDSPAVVAAVMGGLLGKPVFISIHNTGKVEALTRRFMGKTILRILVSGCRSMISINSKISTELSRAGCPPGKITFLPNGVDTGLFCEATDEEVHRERAAIGVRGKTVYLFVGNLHDQKGVDTLLRAWSRFERDTAMGRAVLLIIGDGALFSELKRLTVHLGLTSSVHFLGMRDDIHRYLKISDVFVQPSRWEGLSIALLEALASSSAVIATPVGGTAEIIREGSNGLIVPVDDEAALANKMKVLFYDMDLRKKIGRSARETVLERYSLKRCAAKHLELFSGSMEKGGSGVEVGSITEDRTASLERYEPPPEKETEALSGIIP